MTFIVRGQFKYTPCKCLAKTILLLDMYRTSYIQSVFCCVHITCPMQTTRRLDKQLFDERRVPAVSLWVHLMSRQGEDMQILSWDILKAPSRQVKIYLVFWYCCIQYYCNLLASFFLFFFCFLKWSDPDQRLSFHFYIIKDVVCRRCSKIDEIALRTVKVLYPGDA